MYNNYLLTSSENKGFIIFFVGTLSTIGELINSLIVLMFTFIV